jgi:hypothetical protein
MMKPYTRENSKGRRMAGDDIHHRTADMPRKQGKLVAKKARHGARQEAAKLSSNLH